MVWIDRKHLFVGSTPEQDANCVVDLHGASWAPM
jgi:hypothetical protein